jgi:hypothetical protein
MRKAVNWFTVGLAALGLSCTGLVDEGPAGPRDGLGSANVEGPAPLTRIPRLTHVQWENSVRDLFRLEAAPEGRDELREDARRGGFLFDTDVARLEVDEALWQGYERVALALAKHIVSDADLLARIVPPDQGDVRARGEQFVRDFGRRAHRRPLSDEEVAEYMVLFDAAPSLDPDFEPFEAGVRFVLEAFLQSPYFIYRIEWSEDAQDNQIPLDGYELASRMSYLLWNTMPDDALLDAAAAGVLGDPEGVMAEAYRMLDDPRAEETLARFHFQLLDVGRFSTISPSDAFFPEAPANLGEIARRENELFIRHVFDAYDGGWSDLLTLPETFVNADLARIYGLGDGFGDELEHVTLDPTQRRGLFTQVGFLAANATSVLSDPIHRGVFIAERITCLHIAAPPDDLPTIQPQEGLTNREVIESITEEPGTVCASCHTPLINPFGFPFENYDAIGAWQTEDNGQPVDTTAAPLIGADPVPVDNALDLIDHLADSRAVHECYVQHWLEYAFGRSKVAQDGPLIERLGEASLEQASLRTLLADLVSSPAFMTRSMEELN